MATEVGPPAKKVAPQGTTDSDGNETDATALFYESWMTGWSLQSCRNLYFDDYSQAGPREKLLSWLSTAVDLVNKWEVVDSSVEDNLKKMLDDVSQATPQTVKVDAFDRDVAEILGTIRAQVPYGYHTATFASDSSRLPYPRKTDIGKDALLNTLLRLRGSLSKIRHVVPQGAFDVIDNDLKKMIKKNESPFGDLLAISDDKTKQEKQMTEVVQVWADLILGTLAAKDALRRPGKTLLYMSVGAVGLVLFSIVGLVIALVFLAIPILTGTGAAGLTLSTMKDLISSISTLVTTLSAVGLSLLLLATKAWNGVKAFEPWAAVQLADGPGCERECMSNQSPLVEMWRFN